MARVIYYYMVYHEMPYSELLYFTGNVHVLNKEISDWIVNGHYYLVLLQFPHKSIS